LILPWNTVLITNNLT